jgi:acetyltransferase-like isoleucine patch superfamily enzyme
LPFFRKLRSYWRKKENPNVIVGTTTNVCKSAIIEDRNGGSIKIGEGCEIFDGVLILSYGGNIEIGNNCSINPYTIIYGHGGVKIGDNVLIAGGVMIIPNNHNFNKKNKTIIEQGCTAKGIVIEEDVWIGHGCSILDGIVIGKGTVIAAGSVVNKSTEPYSVMAGVPAKVIKHRE